MRIINWKIIFAAFFLLPKFSFSQPTVFYKEKISKYLDKENALLPYYALWDKNLKIYPSEEAKAKDSCEINFEFSSAQQSARQVVVNFHPTKEKPLNGMRIAIDPGHVAGNPETAKMEMRYVALATSGGKKNRKNVSLIEGNLTLATALLLQKDLEKAGAIVLLTRNKKNTSSFEMSFEDWVETKFQPALDSAYTKEDISYEEKNFLETKATKTEIFRRFFTNEDIRQRARIINAFHPDISIIIHYNAEATSDGVTKTTNKNFVMAFVPGAFMQNEMEKKTDRKEFLRLIVSNDIENSIRLSEIMVQSFSETLNVPIAKNSDASYLDDYCLATSSAGVYCRNLSLTRLVHGTLVYGETLYQNNSKEFESLKKNEITVEKIKTSKRVKQVSDAYYYGVLKFASTVK